MSLVAGLVGVLGSVRNPEKPKWRPLNAEIL